MFSKRMNRAPYALINIGVALVTAIVAVVVLTSGMPRSLYDDKDLLEGALALLAAPVIIAASIPRLHDLDLSGWWAPLLFVPYAGLFFSIYLLFARGSVGDNRFGPDPFGRPSILPDGAMGLALGGTAASKTSASEGATQPQM